MVDRTSSVEPGPPVADIVSIRGTFARADVMQDAVESLMVSGFDRADLSVGMTGPLTAVLRAAIRQPITSQCRSTERCNRSARLRPHERGDESWPTGTPAHERHVVETTHMWEGEDLPPDNTPPVEAHASGPTRW